MQNAARSDTFASAKGAHMQRMRTSADANAVVDADDADVDDANVLF